MPSSMSSCLCCARSGLIGLPYSPPHFTPPHTHAVRGTGRFGDPFLPSASEGGGGAGPSGKGARAGAGGARAAAAPKLTPLEAQVVALHDANPGTLLIVEVGYKMRTFGEDAVAAAAACNVACYPDHAFLSAGFPVPRAPLYVRRLCAAGHRVGVVRQVGLHCHPTAALPRDRPVPDPQACRRGRVPDRPRAPTQPHTHSPTHWATHLVVFS
jgi:hypothetical protein